MSNAGPVDPLDGIRDVFIAYKMLSPLATKSYLEIVVKQLEKVFGHETGPPGGNESQALTTTWNVFLAYKKLNKWDPETASEILVEQLERVFALKKNESANTNLEPDPLKEDEDLQFVGVFKPETSHVSPTAIKTEVDQRPSTSQSLISPAAKEVSSPSSDVTTVDGVSGQSSRCKDGKFKAVNRRAFQSRKKIKWQNVSHKLSYLGRKLKTLIKQAKSSNNNMDSISPSTKAEAQDGGPGQDETNNIQIEGRPRRAAAGRPREKWAESLSVVKPPAAKESKKPRVTKRRKVVVKKKGGGKNKCPHCRKTVGAYYLPFHIRLHTGETPFFCQHCHTKFATGGTLRIHLKRRERRFPCRFQPCCSSANSEKARDDHEVHRHGCIANADITSVDDNFVNPDVLIPEVEIEESFPSGPRKSSKRKRRPAKCGICSYLFSTQTLLKSHMRKDHADPRERPHACQFCGERFKQKCHCRAHESFQHPQTNTGLPICPPCSLQFLSLNHLREHIQAKHFGFLCSI